MDEEKRGQVQTVKEMFAQYPDEWIFFEVLEEDEYERPTKGILLAHHPDREKFDKLMMQHKVRHGATRYTGPIVPPEYQSIPYCSPPAHPGPGTGPVKSRLYPPPFPLPVVRRFPQWLDRVDQAVTVCKSK